MVMKTDEPFYELFRLDPNSLFQLVRLAVDGEYAFESITVKSTEKRVDGFFKRIDGPGPNIFLEVQGYYDKTIYWRLFREICTWYEQTGDTQTFIAIVLFVDKRFDPESCPLTCSPPNRMISGHLEGFLEASADTRGTLTILKPLTAMVLKDFPEKVRQWRSEIDALGLPPNKTEALMQLLAYSVVQRFPERTLKEVQQMVQLTPLEKTTAGKELIQIGIEKGLKEGLQQGQLEEAREMVISAIETRFEIVPGSIIDTIRAINRKDTLKMLLRQAIRCADIDQFREKLRLVD